MKKKKILFVITKSEVGGAQKFLFGLASSIDKGEYDITVAAGFGGPLLEKLAGVQIQTLKLRHFSNLLGYKSIPAFFELFCTIRKQRPDILYLLSSSAGFWGSVAGFLNRTPLIIYRIGGWAFKEPKPLIVRRLYLLAEKITSPFKDFIIVNSKFDFDLAVKNKIAEENKLRVIYNGLDAEEINFFDKKAARQNFFANQNDEIWIGTIANLYKNKGLNYLIEAACEIKIDFPKIKFIICGEGAEKQSLQELIESYGLKNTVYLVGKVNEAVKLIRAFDVFALPSVKEGQPWVILEAMAAGVPIVATNIAGVPEMIEDQKSGLLVEPADSHALAFAIKKLLTHPSLSKEINQNAFMALQENFSKEAMIVKNEELFK